LVSGTSIAFVNIASHQGGDTNMKTISTSFATLIMAGFIGVAAAGLLGCTYTEPVAYNPPVKVVHEPTALNVVPPSTNSTTTTTQYGNGTVEKQTTTDYNPGYVTPGPPYKTTVVPAAPPAP
jgi:hypothetical protein